MVITTERIESVVPRVVAVVAIPRVIPASVPVGVVRTVYAVSTIVIPRPTAVPWVDVPRVVPIKVISVVIIIQILEATQHFREPVVVLRVV